MSLKLKTGPKMRKHTGKLARKRAESSKKLHAMLKQGMKDRPGKGC